jgi:hypothetical protein
MHDLLSIGKLFETSEAYDCSTGNTMNLEVTFDGDLILSMHEMVVMQISTVKESAFFGCLLFLTSRGGSKNG